MILVFLGALTMSTPTQSAGGFGFELVEVTREAGRFHYALRAAVWELAGRRSLPVPSWMRQWRLPTPEAQALSLGQARWPIFAITRHGRAVEIATPAGMWVVDLEGTKTIADVELKSEGPRFFVDRGRYEITVNDATCQGDTAQHGNLLASCGGYRFVFNGSELLLLDRDYRAVARAAYDSRFDVAPRQGEMYGMKLAVPSLDASLRIDGIVYMR